MLYAKQQGGNYVNAQDANRVEHYFCPTCRQAVILKRGELKAAHFAHREHGCSAFSEGETSEHLAGKQLLVKLWSQLDCQVELEAYQANLRQRPDVLCAFPDGHQLALEFQCAPLSVSQMVHRSAGYQTAHFKFFWLLGQRHYLRKHLTQQIVQFIRWHANVGFYLVYLNPAYQRFEVLYGIQMADLLPVKYFRFYTKSVPQLLHFFQTDHHVRYLPLTQRERNQQEQRLALKIHYRDRQIYAAQNFCYRHHWSFAETARSTLASSYFPPIYRHPPYLWKIFAKDLVNSSQSWQQVLTPKILFQLPFVKLGPVCAQEWQNFGKVMRKIAFSSNYRYN